MIDTTENTVTSARSFTPTFDPGQPVTGRRWGEQDLITGRYVEPFGTDNVGMLIDLPNGERAAIVTQTASKVGRHSAALLLPIRGQDVTQVFPAIAPAEQTAIEPVTGEIDPEATAECNMPAELDYEDDEADAGFFDDEDDQVAEHTAELEALAGPQPVSRWRRGIEWVKNNWTVVRVAFLAACIGAALAQTIGWLAR